MIEAADKRGLTRASAKQARLAVQYLKRTMDEEMGPHRGTYTKFEATWGHTARIKVPHDYGPT